MKTGRSSITAKAARAAGVSRKKADRAFEALVGVIGERMKTERVTIDNFGVFGPPANLNDPYQWFRPAAELVHRCTARIESVPTPKKSSVRPEDDAYIDRWLAVRRGQEAQRVSVSTLFGRQSTKRQPMRCLSEETVNTARRTMRTFAARCAVPIAKLGLDSTGPESLRSGIVAYAEDFQARMQPRIQKLIVALDGQERRQVPVALRTVAWSNFVRYAYDFYEWLIQEGIRPPGSNPLEGIDKSFFNPIDFNKGALKIVRAWYSKILRYPRLRPRQRAILMLLANGLRISEAARVRIEHLDLVEGKVSIVRKRGKLRPVLLMPWARDAITAYLNTRWDKPSPWLFPSLSRDVDRPITHHGIRSMVATVTARVYPRDDQAHIRAAIHPHGFRHYYATNALASGMSESAVQHQLGHSSTAMTKIYITPDEEFIRSQHALVANRKWF